MSISSSAEDRSDSAAGLGILKQALTKAVNLSRAKDKFVTGFFDHLLRNDESYAQNGITFARIPCAPD
jgi:hypothetical protein